MTIERRVSGCWRTCLTAMARLAVLARLSLMAGPRVMVRPGGLVLVVSLTVLPGLTLGGCKRSNSKPAPASDASVKPARRQPGSCRPLPGTRRIGKVGSQPDDDQVPLPFAAEIGSGVATPWGFAVAGLVHEQGATRAVVVAADAQLKRARTVDLGRVHGNVDPPLLAVTGSGLLVVVPDGDVSGSRLRLALVSDPLGAGRVTWGAEASQHWDAGQGFAVAAGERGALAFEDFSRGRGRSVARVLTLDLDNPSSSLPARRVSPASADVDTPRLSPRRGGYWLAWLRRREARGNTGPTSSDAPGLVDLGQRGLEVVPLDEHGVPTAKPQAVSPEGVTVLLYDLATSPDGSALFAYRDDAVSPGAERRRLRLARVSADGTIVRESFQHEALGGGVPVLLPTGARGPSTPGVWLGVPGAGSRSQLLALGPRGAPGALLSVPAVAAHVDPLAARGERVLVAGPRGMAVDLQLLRCRLTP